MAAIYETEDGQEFEADNVQRKEKCDFCGKLGELPDEDGFLDGQLVNISGEGYAGDRADACRECLTNGIPKEELDEAIGSKEEIKEEMKESVELS